MAATSLGKQRQPADTRGAALPAARNTGGGSPARLDIYHGSQSGRSVHRIPATKGDAVACPNMAPRGAGACKDASEFRPAGIPLLQLPHEHKSAVLQRIGIV